jgi:dTDP-4-dehydrorhamnose reductase
MKILLLGKQGQVGWELQRSLSPLGEVIAYGRAGANLEDPDALRRIVRDTAPQIIVNAAAYTAVDKAEAESERARQINTDAVGILAEECKQLGAWLIHYSTDYVFDGNKAGPYAETDHPAPQSVYGQTKCDGERAIQASGCQHLIFRTSWVYAARGGNFAKTMLRLAGERDTLNVVSDQIGAPTSAELIADITALCLYRLTHDNAFAERASGIYHLTSSGVTNWHGYAQLLIAEALALGINLRTTPENVKPIPTSAYPLPAKRPANSQLNTQKLRDSFGITLPPWQQGVTRLLNEILAK